MSTDSKPPIDPYFVQSLLAPSTYVSDFYISVSEPGMVRISLFERANKMNKEGQIETALQVRGAFMISESAFYAFYDLVGRTLALIRSKKENDNFGITIGNERPN